MSSRLRRAFTAPKPVNPNSLVYLTSAELEKKALDEAYWESVALAEQTGGEVERLWGLENFGNTCYCNSVLQALYACEPFKQFVEAYPDPPPPLAPLGPAPGSKLFSPIEKSASASSPLATKRDNPFDAPAAGLAVPNGSKLPSSSAAGKADGKEKKWGLGRRPSSSTAANASAGSAPSLAALQQAHSSTATTGALPSGPSALDKPIPIANPDQPPPSVFETVQTLFYHLTNSMPHQPIATKPVNKDAQSAQTASILPNNPAGPNGNAPGSPAPNSSGGQKDPNGPQGPPLLASLPPPSAPRGGGPYGAGSIGRGVVRPEDLLKTVKKENEMFRGMSQQDAHEFLGWLLNHVAEDVEKVDRHLKDIGKSVGEEVVKGKTFVQNLFEGVLTNETRCLSCEMTSSRDELFLDLSIDIEQHTSVTSCLRQFSASEMLCQKNKFYCDSCCGLQEAEKRMKIKRLPNVLALHLKRFKYQETLNRFTKLFYRVPFPLELRLPNTSDETENPDRLYELFAVVVHIGNGPHHGHYVCIVKSANRWVMCDDENVEPIEESDIYRYFGDFPSGAGYVLFYQAADLNLADLGLKVPSAAARPHVSVTAPSSGLADVKEESPVVPSSSTLPPKASHPSQPRRVIIDTISNAPPKAAETNGTNGNAITSPVVDKQYGFSPMAEKEAAATPTATATSPRLENTRQQSSSWLSRMAMTSKDKKGDTPTVPTPPQRLNSGDTVTPTPTPGRGLQRNPTTTSVATTTGSTTGSTTFGGLGVNVPSAYAGASPEGVQGVSTSASTPGGQARTSQSPSRPVVNVPTPPSGSMPPAAPASPTGMSSSVMSNLSGVTSISTTSRSTSSAPPPPGTSLSPSANHVLNASVPPSSYTSPSPGGSSSLIGGLGVGRRVSNTNTDKSRDRAVSGSSQGSAPGGGGLSRRLSGISRSSSKAFKLGFGKKDKDKDGIKE